MRNRYLTNATVSILEDKFFDTISKYRRIKFDLSILEKDRLTPEAYKKHATNKKEFVLAEYNRIKKEADINEDCWEGYRFDGHTFIASLNQDELEKQAHELYQKWIHQFDQVTQRIKELKTILDLTYKAIQALSKIKKDGFLNETEISILQHKINNKFFDTFISLLSDQADLTIKLESQFYLKNDQEIENLFTKMATDKINGVKSERKLYLVMNNIGIFKSSIGYQKSDFFINSAKHYIQTNSVQNGISPSSKSITSTYGLRQKVIDIKNKMDNERAQTETSEQFINSLSL